MKAYVARGYVQLKSKGLPVSTNPKKRGCVKAFSCASSKRLSVLLAEMDIPSPCVHASLTYGAEYPTENKEVIRNQENLMLALRRKGFFGIWKKEYQKRGAIHYHIILWHHNDYDPEYHGDVIRGIWEGISKNASDHAAKLTPGDTALATFYLALHHAKRDEQTQSGSGRWWGYINRAEVVSYRNVDQIDLSEEQQKWLARIFRRRMAAQARLHKRNYRHDMGLRKGFHFFLGQVDKYKLLRYLQNREYDF